MKTSTPVLGVYIGALSLLFFTTVLGNINEVLESEGVGAEQLVVKVEEGRVVLWEEGCLEEEMESKSWNYTQTAADGCMITIDSVYVLGGTAGCLPLGVDSIIVVISVSGLEDTLGLEGTVYFEVDEVPTLPIIVSNQNNVPYTLLVPSLGNESPVDIQASLVGVCEGNELPTEVLLELDMGGTPDLEEFTDTVSNIYSYEIETCDCAITIVEPIVQTCLPNGLYTLDITYQLEGGELDGLGLFTYYVGEDSVEIALPMPNPMTTNEFTVTLTHPNFIADDDTDIEVYIQDNASMLPDLFSNGCVSDTVQFNEESCGDCSLHIDSVLTTCVIDGLYNLFFFASADTLTIGAFGYVVADREGVGIYQGSFEGDNVDTAVFTPVLGLSSENWMAGDSLTIYITDTLNNNCMDSIKFAVPNCNCNLKIDTLGSVIDCNSDGSYELTFSVTNIGELDLSGEMVEYVIYDADGMLLDSGGTVLLAGSLGTVTTNTISGQPLGISVFLADDPSCSDTVANYTSSLISTCENNVDCSIAINNIDAGCSYDGTYILNFDVQYSGNVLGQRFEYGLFANGMQIRGNLNPYQNDGSTPIEEVLLNEMVDSIVVVDEVNELCRAVALVPVDIIPDCEPCSFVIHRIDSVCNYDGTHDFRFWVEVSGDGFTLDGLTYKYSLNNQLQTETFFHEDTITLPNLFHGDGALDIEIEIENEPACDTSFIYTNSVRCECSFFVEVVDHEFSCNVDETYNMAIHIMVDGNALGDSLIFSFSEAVGYTGDMVIPYSSLPLDIVIVLDSLQILGLDDFIELTIRDNQYPFEEEGLCGASTFTTMYVEPNCELCQIDTSSITVTCNPDGTTNLAVKVAVQGSGLSDTLIYDIAGEEGTVIVEDGVACIDLFDLTIATPTISIQIADSIAGSSLESCFVDIDYAIQACEACVLDVHEPQLLDCLPNGHAVVNVEIDARLDEASDNFGEGVYLYITKIPTTSSTDTLVVGTIAYTTIEHPDTLFSYELPADGDSLQIQVVDQRFPEDCSDEHRFKALDCQPCALTATIDNIDCLANGQFNLTATVDENGDGYSNHFYAFVLDEEDNGISDTIIWNYENSVGLVMDSLTIPESSSLVHIVVVDSIIVGAFTAGIELNIDTVCAAKATSNSIPECEVCMLAIPINDIIIEDCDLYGLYTLNFTVDPPIGTVVSDSFYYEIFGNNGEDNVRLAEGYEHYSMNGPKVVTVENLPAKNTNVAIYVIDADIKASLPETCTSEQLTCSSNTNTMRCDGNIVDCATCGRYDSPDCSPCMLEVAIIEPYECAEDGTYTLQLIVSGESPVALDHFTLRLTDGADLDRAEIYDYDEEGDTISISGLPANGALTNIWIQDATAATLGEDTVCNVYADYTAPTCQPCNIVIDSFFVETCRDNNTHQVYFGIDTSGLILADTFLYKLTVLDTDWDTSSYVSYSDAMSVDSIFELTDLAIPAGELQLTVIAAGDCQADSIYTDPIPECDPCQLTIIDPQADPETCVNDSVTLRFGVRTELTDFRTRFTYTITGSGLMESISKELDYTEDTTWIDIRLLGNGMPVNIVVQDTTNANCQDSASPIPIPNCATESCLIDRFDLEGIECVPYSGVGARDNAFIATICYTGMADALTINEDGGDIIQNDLDSLKTDGCIKIRYENNGTTRTQATVTIDDESGPCTFEPIAIEGILCTCSIDNIEFLGTSCMESDGDGYQVSIKVTGETDEQLSILAESTSGAFIGQDTLRIPNGTTERILTYNYPSKTDSFYLTLINNNEVCDLVWSESGILPYFEVTMEEDSAPQTTCQFGGEDYTLMFSIRYEHVDSAGQLFYQIGDGEMHDVFYESEPNGQMDSITVSNLASIGEMNIPITIWDSQYPDCGYTFFYDAPEACCNIISIDATGTTCYDDGSFDLTFEVSHSGQTGSQPQFFYGINEEPAIVQFYENDGTTTVTITNLNTDIIIIKVADGENGETCNDSISINRPFCPINTCHVAILEDRIKSACIPEMPNHFNLSFAFSHNYVDINDELAYYINDEFIDKVTATAIADTLPIILPTQNFSAGDTLILKVVHLSDADCIADSIEWIAPYCDCSLDFSFSEAMCVDTTGEELKVIIEWEANPNYVLQQPDTSITIWQQIGTDEPTPIDFNTTSTPNTSVSGVDTITFTNGDYRIWIEDQEGYCHADTFTYEFLDCDCSDQAFTSSLACSEEDQFDGQPYYNLSLRWEEVNHPLLITDGLRNNLERRDSVYSNGTNTNQIFYFPTNEPYQLFMESTIKACGVDTFQGGMAVDVYCINADYYIVEYIWYGGETGTEIVLTDITGLAENTTGDAALDAQYHIAAAGTDTFTHQADTIAFLYLKNDALVDREAVHYGIEATHIIKKIVSGEEEIQTIDCQVAGVSGPSPRCICEIDQMDIAVSCYDTAHYQVEVIWAGLYADRSVRLIDSTGLATIAPGSDTIYLSSADTFTLIYPDSIPYHIYASDKEGFCDTTWRLDTTDQQVPNCSCTDSLIVVDTKCIDDLTYAVTVTYYLEDPEDSVYLMAEILFPEGNGHVDPIPLGTDTFIYYFPIDKDYQITLQNIDRSYCEHDALSISSTGGAYIRPENCNCPTEEEDFGFELIEVKCIPGEEDKYEVVVIVDHLEGIAVVAENALGQGSEDVINNGAQKKITFTYLTTTDYQIKLENTLREDCTATTVILEGRAPKCPCLLSGLELIAIDSISQCSELTYTVTVGILGHLDIDLTGIHLIDETATTIAPQYLSNNNPTVTFTYPLGQDYHITIGDDNDFCTAIDAVMGIAPDTCTACPIACLPPDCNVGGFEIDSIYCLGELDLPDDQFAVVFSWEGQDSSVYVVAQNAIGEPDTSFAPQLSASGMDTFIFESSVIDIELRVIDSDQQCDTIILTGMQQADCPPDCIVFEVASTQLRYRIDQPDSIVLNNIVGSNPDIGIVVQYYPIDDFSFIDTDNIISGGDSIIPIAQRLLDLYAHRCSSVVINSTIHLINIETQELITACTSKSITHTLFPAQPDVTILEEPNCTIGARIQLGYGGDTLCFEPDTIAPPNCDEVGRLYSIRADSLAMLLTGDSINAGCYADIDSTIAFGDCVSPEECCTLEIDSMLTASCGNNATYNLAFLVKNASNDIKVTINQEPVEESKLSVMPDGNDLAVSLIVDRAVVDSSFSIVVSDSTCEDSLYTQVEPCGEGIDDWLELPVCDCGGKALPVEEIAYCSGEEVSLTINPVDCIVPNWCVDEVKQVLIYDLDGSGALADGALNFDVYQELAQGEQGKDWQILSIAETDTTGDLKIAVGGLRANKCTGAIFRAAIVPLVIDALPMIGNGGLMNVRIVDYNPALPIVPVQYVIFPPVERVKAVVSEIENCGADVVSIDIYTIIENKDGSIDENFCSKIEQDVESSQTTVAGCQRILTYDYNAVFPVNQNGIVLAADIKCRGSITTSGDSPCGCPCSSIIGGLIVQVDSTVRPVNPFISDYLPFNITIGWQVHPELAALDLTFPYHYIIKNENGDTIREDPTYEYETNDPRPLIVDNLPADGGTYWVVFTNQLNGEDVCKDSVSFKAPLYPICPIKSVSEEVVDCQSEEDATYLVNTIIELYYPYDIKASGGIMEPDPREHTTVEIEGEFSKFNKYDLKIFADNRCDTTFIVGNSACSIADCADRDYIIHSSVLCESDSTYLVTFSWIGGPYINFELVDLLNNSIGEIAHNSETITNAETGSFCLRYDRNESYCVALKGGACQKNYEGNAPDCNGSLVYQVNHDDLHHATCSGIEEDITINIMDCQASSSLQTGFVWGYAYEATNEQQAIYENDFADVLTLPIAPSSVLWKVLPETFVEACTPDDHFSFPLPHLSQLFTNEACQVQAFTLALLPAQYDIGGDANAQLVQIDTTDYTIIGYYVFPNKNELHINTTIGDCDTPAYVSIWSADNSMVCLQDSSEFNCLQLHPYNYEQFAFEEDSLYFPFIQETCWQEPLVVETETNCADIEECNCDNLDLVDIYPIVDPYFTCLEEITAFFGESNTNTTYFWTICVAEDTVDELTTQELLLDYTFEWMDNFDRISGGAYTVKLRAEKMLNNGQVCRDTTERYIRVMTSGVLDFNCSIDTLNRQATFELTGGEIIPNANYSWTSDGGTISTLPESFNHTFPSYGTYELCLFSEYDNCSLNTCKSIDLYPPCSNTLPIDLTLPENICVGDSIRGIGQTMLPTEDTDFIWRWYVNGQPIPTTYYGEETTTDTSWIAEEGQSQYIVQLEVHVVDSCHYGTITDTIFVNDYQADQLFIGQNTGGNTMQFTPIFNPNNAATKVYDWRFLTLDSVEINASMEEKPEITFPTDGIYLVCLSMTIGGCELSVCDTISVHPIIADFDLGSDSVCLYDPINLKNAAQTVADEDSLYTWTIQHNGNSIQLNQYQIDTFFSEIGHYEVELCLQQGGIKACKDTTIVVNNCYNCAALQLTLEPINPDILINDTVFVCVQEEVCFNLTQSVFINGNTYPLEPRFTDIRWIEDGNLSPDQDNCIVEDGTGTLQVLVRAIGVLDATCVLEDSLWITTNNPPLDRDIEVTATSGDLPINNSISVCNGDSLMFNTIREERTDSIYWYIVDGEDTSFQSNADSWFLANPLIQDYHIQLIRFSGYGCHTTQNISITIQEADSTVCYPCQAQAKAITDSITTTNNRLQFCQGESINLCVNECPNKQGETLSSTHPYSWTVNLSNSEEIDTLIEGNIDTTLSTIGDYQWILYYQLEDCPQPLPIDTQIITIFDTPQALLQTEAGEPLANDTILYRCTGESLTLNTPTDEDFSHHWEINGGAPMAINDSLDYTTQTTDDTLHIHLIKQQANNTICADTAKVVLVVTKPPTPMFTIDGQSIETIEDTMMFCLGETMMLETTTEENRTIIWELGGNVISNENSTDYTFSAIENTGADTLALTLTKQNSDGACKGDTTITIIIAENPDATFTVQPYFDPCESNVAGKGKWMLQLTPENQTLSTYQWEINGEIMSMDMIYNYPVEMANILDSVRLIVTNQWGCSSETTNVNVMTRPEKELDLLVNDTLCINSTIDLTTCINEGVEVGTISWDIYRKSAVDQNYAFIETSNENPLPYTFTKRGDYRIDRIFAYTCPADGTAYVDTDSSFYTITANPEVCTDCLADELVDLVDATFIETHCLRIEQLDTLPNTDWIHLEEDQAAAAYWEITGGQSMINEQIDWSVLSYEFPDSGTYQIKLVVTWGDCIYTDSISVRITPEISDFLPDIVTICSGDSLPDDLFAEGNIYSGTIQCTLEPDITTNSFQNENSTIESDLTVYVLCQTTDDRCLTMDSMIVIFQPKPDIQVTNHHFMHIRNSEQDSSYLEFWLDDVQHLEGEITTSHGYPVVQEESDPTHFYTQINGDAAEIRLFIPIMEVGACSADTVEHDIENSCIPPNIPIAQDTTICLNKPLNWSNPLTTLGDQYDSFSWLIIGGGEPIPSSADENLTDLWLERAGNYEVYLIARGPNCQLGLELATVSVIDTIATAEFTYTPSFACPNGDGFVFVDATITFEAINQYMDRAELSFEWMDTVWNNDFTQAISWRNMDQNSPSAQIHFASTGRRIIYLTITDNFCGNTVTWQDTINVINPCDILPDDTAISFDYTPEECWTGEQVTFEIDHNIPSCFAEFFEFHWRAIDAVSSTIVYEDTTPETSWTHTFAETGNYLIEVDVINTQCSNVNPISAIKNTANEHLIVNDRCDIYLDSSMFDAQFNPAFTIQVNGESMIDLTTSIGPNVQLKAIPNFDLLEDVGNCLQYHWMIQTINSPVEENIDTITNQNSFDVSLAEGQYLVQVAFKDSCCGWSVFEGRSLPIIFDVEEQCHTLADGQFVDITQDPVVIDEGTTSVTFTASISSQSTNTNNLIYTWSGWGINEITTTNSLTIDNLTANQLSSGGSIIVSIKEENNLDCGRVLDDIKRVCVTNNQGCSAWNQDEPLFITTADNSTSIIAGQPTTLAVGVNVPTGRTPMYQRAIWEVGTEIDSETSQLISDWSDSYIFDGDGDFNVCLTVQDISPGCCLDEDTCWVVCVGLDCGISMTKPCEVWGTIDTSDIFIQIPNDTTIVEGNNPIDDFEVQVDIPENRPVRYIWKIIDNEIMGTIYQDTLDNPILMDYRFDTLGVGTFDVCITMIDEMCEEVARDTSWTLTIENDCVIPEGEIVVTSDTLCENKIARFSYSGSIGDEDGIMFTWASSEGDSSNTALFNPNLNTLGEGMISLTLSKDGCSSITKEKVVYVLPEPQADFCCQVDGFSIECWVKNNPRDSGFTFEDSAFEWIFEDRSPLYGDTIIHTFSESVQNTNITLLISTCDDDQQSMSLSLPSSMVDTLCSDETGKNKWKGQFYDFQAHISPNPTSSHFSLNYQYNGSAPLQLRVYNIHGKLMHQEALPNQGSHQQWIHTDQWQNGTYLVEVTNGKQRQVHKLVVLKE